MNAIKRFVKLLTSPLMPIRLFATEESDHADDFDFSWTDEPSGYYDSEGNYLGDDAAAAEAAGVDTNYDEYSDDFGNVEIQTDGNGNITGASYRDPETGEWKDSGLSGYQEAYGRTSEGQAKQAEQVFGASMTPETLAALGSANEADVSTVLEGAKNGNPAAVALASVMTGTMPDADSLKGLGYTEEEIKTASEFATAMAQALAEGNSPNAAWNVASTKTGDPYGTKGRDTMLLLAGMSPVLLAGGAGALLGGGAAAAAIASSIGKGSTMPGSKKLLPTSDSDDAATKSSEPTAASKSSSEPAATPKSDPVITTNPFDKGEPEISIPEGPLAGTPLSGTGLPGHESEPTKEDAEDRGFENDDSGSDTMEETSQDAPTSGLGGDTFANPNNDNERKGWGLGEEDPNRANYDTDKWNRGMERVSTDVVSDEKCKAFISKTFKDDPVLIKAVKIMKTIK